jgi:hypothetical protein
MSYPESIVHNVINRIGEELETSTRPLLPFARKESRILEEDCMSGWKLLEEHVETPEIRALCAHRSITLVFSRRVKRQVWGQGGKASFQSLNDLMI